MKQRANLRTLLAGATFTAVIGSVVAVVGVLAGTWKLGLPGEDRSTVAGLVLPLAAYILVALGSLVALGAYLAATGTPDLTVDISFRFSDTNKPVFKADEDSFGRSQVTPFRQTEGRVVIHNRSRYAARNTGIRIDLEGCGGIAAPEGWAAVASANMVGTTSLQWDAGGDLMVHGRWSRVVPNFDVPGLTRFQPSETAFLVVTVVADGCTPKLNRLPISFLSEAEYTTYSQERGQRLLSPTTGPDGAG